ncbi:hypothetical protein DRO54_04835, partial [Candidatus Bathyarchaeota archaeon]
TLYAAYRKHGIAAFKDLLGKLRMIAVEPTLADVFGTQKKFTKQLFLAKTPTKLHNIEDVRGYKLNIANAVHVLRGTTSKEVLPPVQTQSTPKTSSTSSQATPVAADITDGQIQVLKKLSVEIPSGCTYTEAESLISATSPASIRQLRMLKSLGIKHDINISRDEASVLIKQQRLTTTPKPRIPPQRSNRWS